MSDTNLITVRGRVGTDPKVTLLPSSRSVADFRLGSTRRFRDANGEWRDAETEWFTVKAWGPLAESVATSINRGMPVIVEGVFSTEEWHSGEQLRYRTVITASAVGVDIRHGLVRHVKLHRGAAGNGSTPAGQAPAGTGDVTPPQDATGDEAAATAAGSADDVEEHLASAELADELGAEADPWADSVPAS